MATLLYSQRILKGAMVNTGIDLLQTDFLVIVNRDMENDDVYSWGYMNYMSSDTPILDGNLNFWSRELATHQVVVAPRIDFVPSAKVWVYVGRRWILDSALVEVWTPFNLG